VSGKKLEGLCYCAGTPWGAVPYPLQGRFASFVLYDGIIMHKIVLA